MPKKLPAFDLIPSITAADVQAGKPSDCHKCPAALAIERALAPLGEDLLSVSVQDVYSMIRVRRHDHRWASVEFVAKHPEDLAALIEGFDDRDDGDTTWTEAWGEFPLRFVADLREGPHMAAERKLAASVVSQYFPAQAGK